MKTRSITYLLLLSAAIVYISCSKSSNSLPLVSNSNYAATLLGSSETPPDTSAANGTVAFIFNPTTNVLSGSISFSGFGTATTVAHIHLGAVGVAGNPVFTIEASGPFTSPISYTSPALTSAQVADLMAGNYYVNIHTVKFPNGEIRGQLLLQGSTGGSGGGTGGGGGGGY
jgi:hypothetical protein